jgi:PAS domain S-box-containing protein
MSNPRAFAASQGRRAFPAGAQSGTLSALSADIGSMTEPTRTETPPPRTVPYAWAVALLLVAVGIWLIRQLYVQARENAYGELAAVTKLKTQEIEGWLQEKETYLAEPIDGLIATTLEHWLKHGAPPGRDRQVLTERLAAAQHRAAEYRGVWLFDADGMLQLQGERAAVHVQHPYPEKVREAFRLKRPVLVDFHAEPDAAGRRQVVLELIVPLFTGRDASQHVVGYMLYEIDPGARLFPLIRNWPTASTTAEALLFRLDGDEVVFLSELRGRADAALNLRQPLSAGDGLAVAAARQGGGALSGRDYRGAEAFGVAERITSRGWFVLSKIDRDEVYGKAERDAIMVTIAGSLLIAAVVAMAVLGRRHEQQRRRAALLQAEVARNQSQKKFDYLVRHARDIILLMDEDGNIIEANEAATRAYGRSRDELLGCNVRDLRHPSTLHEIAEQMAAARLNQGLYFETLHCRRDGSPFPVEVSSQIIEYEGRRYRQSIIRDISERKQQEKALLDHIEGLRELNRKLEEAQTQLLQSEKMASIGQLAAGVAHELNNPIGFVHSNLGTLQGYLQDVFAIVDAYEKSAEVLPAADLAGIDTLKREKDLAYLRQDAFQLMDESRDGLARVRKIVQDLKDFSRVGDNDWRWADLHEGLDSTLNIVWNELKYKCRVHKEYGQLPQVYCLPSQLNQVFMNLLVNAGQAIEDKGEITLRSGTEGDRVWIEIADTGKGIARENLTRIFEPFYTTKPVGKGTGLGLSLSYSIVKKHQGSIEVHSEVGRGSTFRVILPVQPVVDAEAEAKTTSSEGHA